MIKTPLWGWPHSCARSVTNERGGAFDPEAKKRFRIEPGEVIRKREIASDGHTHKLPEKVQKKGDPEAEIASGLSRVE